MKLRVIGNFLLFVCLIGTLPRGLISQGFAADQKVAVLKEAPAGLSAEVAAAISENGFRITGKEGTGKDGVICDVWLAKEIAAKPKFKSSLRVKYPFQIGSLIGVIRFPEGSKPADFRGQALKPGTYTLRYGLQPDDGNHLGTTESGVRDFLVGCPPDKDTSPKRIEEIKDVFKMSGPVAGGTHPAIFLLNPPPDNAFDAPAVEHDDAKHLVVLQANANAKDGDKTVPVPLNLVVVGKTEG